MGVPSYGSQFIAVSRGSFLDSLEMKSGVKVRINKHLVHMILGSPILLSSSLMSGLAPSLSSRLNSACPLYRGKSEEKVIAQGCIASAIRPRGIQIQRLLGLAFHMNLLLGFRVKLETPKCRKQQS